MEARSLRHALHSVAIAACALITACAPAAPVTRATFEVAEVVAAGTGGALSAPQFDTSLPPVPVTTITRFELESASVQPDHDGSPAIGFEIVEHEQAAFRAWTAARVGRPMAILVDHRVVTVATIHSELPGSGVLSFGSKPPPPAEIERLAATLAPR